MEFGNEIRWNNETKEGDVETRLGWILIVHFDIKPPNSKD